MFAEARHIADGIRDKYTDPDFPPTMPKVRNNRVKASEVCHSTRDRSQESWTPGLGYSMSEVTIRGFSLCTRPTGQLGLLPFKRSQEHKSHSINVKLESLKQSDAVQLLPKSTGGRFHLNVFSCWNRTSPVVFIPQWVKAKVASILNLFSKTLLAEEIKPFTLKMSLS